MQRWKKVTFIKSLFLWIGKQDNLGAYLTPVSGIMIFFAFFVGEPLIQGSITSPENESSKL